MMTWGVMAERHDASVEYLKIDSSVLSIRKVKDSLEIPWEILWGPDGYIWFTERKGNINRMDPATGEVIKLATIKDCFSYTSSGLLGMALHPDFVKQPYVYVAYTFSPSDSSQIRLKIRRYTYDAKNQQLIEPKDLTKPLWLGSFGAYGCRLLISGRGELFATIGDAGDYSLPQDTSKLQGKIWRLDLDGNPYPGNPFHNEIYSYGHRNPQGLVWAPNGFLYSSEHGPTHDDEINIIKKGGNYGWPNIGGKTDEPDEIDFAKGRKVEDAIYSWTPTIATCGLDYYNSNAIPEFSKALILVTLKQSDMRVLSLDSSGSVITNERVLLSYKFGRLRDVCVSPDGRIFFCTSNDKHHPDQIRSQFDAIYELKFDHKTSDEITVNKVSPAEGNKSMQILLMAVGLALLLLLGVFAYKNEKIQ